MSDEQYEAQGGKARNTQKNTDAKPHRTLLPYLMVSATQTLVEFGSFTILYLLAVPSTAANAVAIVLYVLDKPEEIEIPRIFS